MQYGAQITSGLSDWQVIKRRDGRAEIALEGLWQLEAGAIRAGVARVNPIARVMSETDNAIIVPWADCECDADSSGASGCWRAKVVIPQGGPYRVETSLDAVSKKTGEHWLFRGDIRVHIGAGDLFCVAGQSNAAGYARGEAYDPPDARVRLIRNSGKWDMAAHPINDATDAQDCPNAPMGICGASPFLSFGRRYADAVGVPVGLIQTAQGGSPMSRWDAARGGDLFWNMINKIRAQGGVNAILWYQGCSDASPKDAGEYFESFKRFVVAARAELNAPVPIFTMQLNRFFAQEDIASWAKIKDAQRRAADTIEGVYILPTSDLPMSDDIHTSARGNVALGEALAKQVVSVLRAGEPLGAPTILSAAREGGDIALSFERASGFIIQNARAAAGDFELMDDAGAVEVVSLSAQNNAITLKPARSLVSGARVSYGVSPAGPRAMIVDELSFLPIVSFYEVEVE